MTKGIIYVADNYNEYPEAKKYDNREYTTLEEFAKAIREVEELTDIEEPPIFVDKNGNFIAEFMI